MNILLPSTAAETQLPTTTDKPQPDQASSPATKGPSSAPNSSTRPDPPSNPKTKRLRSQITTLQQQISALESQIATSRSQLQDPNANATVKRHIKFLHDYNEIKDVGQGLMGLIADGRGERVQAVMEGFGIGVKD